MNESKDIRWQQRFSHFAKALAQLGKFIEKEELNELEKQGLIKAFEYTYELAGNTIKDFYEYQGEGAIQGSRDSFRLAFKRGLIKEGATWMEMNKSRQLTVHGYNEETAESIAEAIQSKYFIEFQALRKTMEKLKV